MEEIAQRLVEEFVQQGFTAPQILAIFRNPLSGGPYAFYQAKGQKGQQWISGVIIQVQEKLRPARGYDPEDRTGERRA
ncbi:MAG: hypothetical protein HYY00_00860 [Chloroflexi bacterium]|nr:hypothetical protein [Chloroflexota bacterium]